MPELPEVESTVRYLKERVTGTTITNTTVYWPRTIATHSTKVFCTSVEGFVIGDVFRRGKYIVIGNTTGDGFLFVHLRMSGSLDVIPADFEIAKHDRAVFYLNNGKSIRFNDTRKFGKIYLSDDQDSVVGHLGIEPLSTALTPEKLHSLLQSRTTRMKSLLLNQSIIAGLGNIYVDEALWKARINPKTQAKTVSRVKSTALYHAIVETLEEAIELAGTDFGDNVVHDGMYSPKIYGRDGKPCLRCDRKVQKITVNQRGTHYCPRCQPLP